MRNTQSRQEEGSGGEQETSGFLWLHGLNLWATTHSGLGERISEAEGTKYILTFTHRHMIKHQPVLAKSLLYAECSPWKER